MADALGCTKFTRGCTHDFYLYPARFSPRVASQVIEDFTQPGDLVLDPFMGGGTAIVEGIRLQRTMVGVDINSLAHFIACVRTTPLSDRDEGVLRAWSGMVSRELAGDDVSWIKTERPTNLPMATAVFVSGALALLDELPQLRQRSFARCALLRLGQYYLEGKGASTRSSPTRRSLAKAYPLLVGHLLDGLREYVSLCRSAGVAKHQITSQRTLLHRTSVGLEYDPRVANGPCPRLVFTSPPYPGVHVLYHRWQHRSRRETAAPFWIADLPDGHGEKYYTGGSRTPTGLRNYFEMVTKAFTSVAQLLDRKSKVVQLVGFSDVRRQLPKYLRAMKSAGLEECRTPGTRRLSREVPNRRWYAKMLGHVDASSEILLVHRLSR